MERILSIDHIAIASNCVSCQSACGVRLFECLRDTPVFVVSRRPFGVIVNDVCAEIVLYLISKNHLRLFFSYTLNDGRLCNVMDSAVMLFAKGHEQGRIGMACVIQNCAVTQDRFDCLC